jgi:hypothetical protein
LFIISGIILCSPFIFIFICTLLTSPLQPWFGFLRSWANLTRICKILNFYFSVFEFLCLSLIFSVVVAIFTRRGCFVFYHLGLLGLDVAALIFILRLLRLLLFSNTLRISYPLNLHPWILILIF